MVHLYKDYYLDNDALQFILKKASVIKNEKSKNFGEINYKAIAFCPKFDQLMKEAHRLKLLEGTYTTIQQLEADSKAISDALVKRGIALTKKGD